MINQLKIKVEIEFNSKELCNVIYNSLIIETKYEINERAKVALSIENNVLLLTISSKDSISARAATNSYLKWINLIEKIIQKIDI